MQTNTLTLNVYITRLHFCSQAVRRVRTLGTLLQLASLHTHHTHTCTHPLPHSHLSNIKSLCTSARCTKQFCLQRPAPHRVSWHTGRGSKTHRHPGQDTKHQHHRNPLLLKGSKPPNLLQKYHFYRQSPVLSVPWHQMYADWSIKAWRGITWGNLNNENNEDILILFVSPKAIIIVYYICAVHCAWCSTDGSAQTAFQLSSLMAVMSRLWLHD